MGSAASDQFDNRSQYLGATNSHRHYNHQIAKTTNPDNNYASDLIFGFGNNAKGQLGLGDKLVQSSLRGVHSVKYHHVSREVNLVATGGYFTILVTGLRNQQVFVSGENSYGQLFMRPEKVKQLTTFTELDPVDHPWLSRGVRAIGCGRTFTIVVTMDNRIVSVGSNYEGQLGRTNSRSAFECSKPIGDGSLEFVKVACGLNHSLLLTSDGRVLCAGSRQYSAVVPVDKTVPGYEGWRFFKGFENGVKNVTDIACGLYFSAFLVDNRQVYVCGFNRAGGSQNDSPTLLFDATTVGSQGIKCIACAGRTLVILTKESEVYIHGEALALSQNFSTVTHIPYSSLGIPPSDIRLIAGGEQHMIFVNSQNHVYVCGTDSFGQLGEVVKTMRQLSIGPLCNFNHELECKRREVLHVCCGAYFSVVVLKHQVKSERLWTYCNKQQLTDVEIITLH